MTDRDEKTSEVLVWILTEIGAGMCLIPRTPEERTWNAAHERCKQIVTNYGNEDGLFQMTRKRRAS